MKNFFQSKNFKYILFGLAGFLVILLAFEAGMFVGYRKAAFSYRFGERYYHAFGSHTGRSGLPGDEFLEAYGTAGTIIRLLLPTVLIQDRDGAEKEVRVTADTVIRSFRRTVNSSDLALGQSVVVIGEPDRNAQIVARLIRILPTLATSSPEASPTQ